MKRDAQRQRVAIRTRADGRSLVGTDCGLPAVVRALVSDARFTQVHLILALHLAFYFVAA